MPYTPQKKKKHHRPKRITQESDDGWTTITTSRGIVQDPRGKNVSAPVPAEIPAGYIIDTLTRDFSRCLDLWRNSSCNRACQSILNQTVAGTDRGKVDNCICLGLGSLVDPLSRRVSGLQLAALIDFLELLGLREDTKVYAQDPVFNILDAEFLKSLNIDVVESPAALSMINERTFLFAPHCERAFLYPGLKDKDPLLIVCNGFESVLSGPISTSIRSEESDMARAFLLNRSSIEFPPFGDHPSAFNDLKIYWPRLAEA